MGDYEEDDVSEAMSKFEVSYKRVMDGIDAQIRAYEKEADDYLARFD